MTDWYNEDADWISDGDVDDESLYPLDLYWPPVGGDDGTSGSGDPFYVWF